MAQVEQSSIDNEQIDGAFALAVDVRFDNLGSSSGQKVFELSSGDGADKIWFGQIGTGSDLEFVLVQDGVEYRTIAKDAIQEGKLVTWRIGIDPDGVMRISNDTEVIAQGAGVVPKDIDRPLAAYGADMEGSISDLKIANYGNLAELDPTNPDSPCALTGESACLCGVLRPTDEHVEGERGSIVISDTDTQGDGEWSNVVALTIIPIHAVVLPDGKVFTFGSTEAGGQGGDFVYSLFDPETGVEKVLENTTGTNIFCSNLALDPETGNVIIFGGDGNRNGGGGISGIDSVTVFDYRTQTMSEAEPMDYARWYPSNITLSNGDILVLGGRDKDYLGSTIPEVYDGETGTFRQLTGADMPDLFGGSGGNLDESWWYPHVWENSKGEVIVIEASGNDIYRLDTDGLGSVAKIGQTGFESYKLNSSLLYGNDKVAIIGDDGGIYTADISDLSTAPVFTKVATLENARTNATMISLPDGRVLVVGGSTPFGDNTDQGNGLTNAIYTPTIWDPSDNSLEQGEAQALARLYHSSGLLLPDGSIWSGGGGAPGPLVNTNVEFFRPDYMYDADGNLAQRPEITEAPKNIGAGDTFQITVDDSSDIEMVTAIRSGGMTHARNSDARFVELQFTVVDATTIEITTPDAFILGPGAWMLYAVDTAGVPSEAAIVGVDMADIVETPPLEQTTLQYYGIDREQITGAFELTVEARFDDLGAGEWQRIFDFGNGPAQDNIWLGQVAGTNDMRFEVWVGGTNYAITAVGAIEEGVRADWKVSVDESGYMRMWKNGVAVAEAQGAVPADVERSQDFIGDSNWITDQRLVGEVRNLEIENGTPDPDTPPKVSVTSAGDVVEGAEGEDGTLNFVFSLSHVTTEDVVINYNILGSATGPESVTIEAGQSEVSVALTFTGDDIQELDELVTVEILSATNARLGNKTDISATATILDDDVQSTPAGMSFFAEAIVRFDDLGGGNWQRVFDYGDGPDNNNIWLGQVAGSNEMRFEILDGPTKYAIEAVDGIVEGETARWTAQITSDGTMQLFKDGVLVAEGEGIVPPDVERPSKLVGSSNWGGDTPLIGEVIAITVDEDGSDEVITPVISIAAPADALEGASGETGTLSYLVSLDKAATVDVTATVTITGNATGPQSVTILAGETSATLDVSFNGNDDDNPDEDITVSLSDITNADPGAALSATATILDDDEPVIIAPVISIAAPADALEGASGETGTLSYLVSLDKAATVDVTATVTITGNATGPQSVTILAGETSATLDVSFNGNDDDNADQDITVSLSDIVNADPGAALSATATILDDDDPVVVAPVISIAAPADALEGAAGETGTLSYLVSLDKAATVDVTATVTITGNATGPQSVTILAGETSATLDVSFDGNDDDNADEDITVSLSDIVNADPGAALSATATILDDDEPVVIAPVISIAAPADALEGASGETGTLSYLVSLDKAATVDVTATVTITGNATGPQSVTILAGETSATLDVSFNGNDTDNADQDITVSLSDIVNADPGAALSATATILDDDVQSTPAGMSFFAEAIVRFDDLDGGNWQRVFDYGDGPDNNNIWLGQVDGSNEMRFEILDGPTKYAIEAVDGIVEGETARWTAQITSDGTMQLFKDGALVAEGEGIVPPDVERPSKLVGSSNWGGDTPLIGEVIAITVDEDGSDEVAAPVISVAAPADALEGASGETGTLSYLVSLDKASTVDVTATVTITGNASGPQSVTILAGETSATLDVSFDGNDDDNADQDITVSLSDIVNADPGTALSATATILDDDEPVVIAPVISIAAPADALEGASGETGTLSYLVSLDKAATVDVTATVTITGNATGPQSVTILAGETSATLDVSFNGNDTDNADEDITVSLSDIVNADPGAALSATATILDDDEPVVIAPVISIAAPADALEGASGETGTLSYLVSLDKAATVDVTATVTITGNASGPQSVTILAGETSATLDVSFNGNDDDNPDQDITVSLSDIVNADPGAALSATATILDDDDSTAPVNIIEAGNRGGYFTGTDGNDDFRGGKGQDVFNGGLGDDVYDGAGGYYNQVDFAGSAADYSFERNDDGSVTISNPVQGTDTLRNIDGLWFSGEAKWYPLDDLVAASPTDPGTVNIIEAGNRGGYFVGTDGKDDFRGGKGQDVFNGGLGDDVYDGAGGYYNQVDFAGSAADYSFERNDDGSVTISNPVQGTDTLRNIDGLWFSGEAKWYPLDDLVAASPTDPGTVNIIEAGNRGGYFVGTDGKDDFRGGKGQDVFNGGLGDDVYDGAGGYYNQVDFAGSAADYSFERNDDGSVTISNPVQGTDTLRNIDGLWFSGEAKWYPLDDLVAASPTHPGAVNIIEAGNRGGYFVGTDGKDDFRGGNGNDTFVGGKGDDVYDGGSGGYDQVDLMGRLSDYSFTTNADGSITASHAEYGVDVLKNIDGIWVGEDNMWVSTDDLVTTG